VEACYIKIIILEVDVSSVADINVLYQHVSSVDPVFISDVITGKWMGSQRRQQAISVLVSGTRTSGTKANADHFQI
jgi:hypothetical protein